MYLPPWIQVAHSQSKPWSCESLLLLFLRQECVCFPHVEYQQPNKEMIPPKSSLKPISLLGLLIGAYVISVNYPPKCWQVPSGHGWHSPESCKVEVLSSLFTFYPLSPPRTWNSGAEFCAGRTWGQLGKEWLKSQLKVQSHPYLHPPVRER